MKSSLILTTPPHFKFWRTVFSHGWCALPPFRVDKEHPALWRILTLDAGKTVLVRLEDNNRNGIKVSTESAFSHRQSDRREIVRQLRVCLRLDEDFEEFYREARRRDGFHWVSRAGAGRMLRSPTVFEDVVKMICTTNCSWSLTEVMVHNLCRYFGEPFADAGAAFPRPEAIAGATEKILRKKIKTGYRSPYLLELARNVATGTVDPESWRTSNLPTPELFDEVRSVKGVGPYAAGNILKLLGRYDYLGLDSWCRGKFFEIHKKGRVSRDRVIEKFYEPYGKWKGLFFWLDVTKEWYDHKFPF
jgi:3-methyladenine DNA glycosylase/8-oxoguanine DNA glycosylase